MAREPFGPDDLSTIDLVLQHFPGAAETVTLVRRVSGASAYPITSFVALLEALGGEEATVTLGGKERPVANLRHRIPAFYFPIASEADLVAKLIELRRHARFAEHGPGAHGGPMGPRNIMFKRRMFEGEPPMRMMRRFWGPGEHMRGFEKHMPGEWPQREGDR